MIGLERQDAGPLQLLVKFSGTVPSGFPNRWPKQELYRRPAFSGYGTRGGRILRSTPA
jgi:hypothetical protein